MISKIAISIDLRKFRPSGFREELVLNDGVLAPREMQREAMDALGKSHHALILAPTGVGKSKAVGAISVRQSADGVRKTVVLVPQTIIGKSYDDYRMRFDGAGVLEWSVSPADRMTSQTTTTLYKTKGVVNFLRSGLRKTMVCSYASFVAAFKSLSRGQRRKLFDGVRVWVDECHHMMSVTNGDRSVFNELGGIVNELIEKVSTCRIGMATATFCRGDLQSILKPGTLDRFDIYSYPYDRYFASMRDMESFEYRFVPYQRRKDGYEPAAIIAEMFGQWDAKTIIYVPSVQSRCSHGKQYEVLEILKALGKDESGGEAYREDERGLIRVVRLDGRVLKVMDLVREDGRDVKKQYVEELRSADELDVVIALGMFKEGADWPFAQRAVVIGYRGSFVEMAQIPGRLFRDMPGKTHVEVNHLVQVTLGTDTEEFQGDLDKLVTALLGTMLMEDVMFPDARIGGGGGNGGNGGGKRVDYLDKAVPMDERVSFLGAVFEDAVCALKTFQDGDEVERFRDEEFDGIVGVRLDDGGYDKSHLKEVAERCWGILARPGLKTRGLDVDGVDLKLVRRVNPVSGVFRGMFVTDKMDEKTFERARRAFEKMAWQTAENKRVLLEMAREGKHRPATRKDKLSKVLFNYTSGSNDSYDEVFDREIRMLRPDWFVRLTDVKKEQLLEMARTGKSRPVRKDRLGGALRRYISKNDDSYDEVFAREIRMLRPDWFVRLNADAVDIKKEQLLEMARTGKSIPVRKDRLGGALRQYTNKSSTSYDEVFAGKTRRLCPEWFVGKSGIADVKKEQLLEMARTGKSRPFWKDTLGHSLNNYLGKNSCSYDEVFDRKIRRLRPDWFRRAA